MTILIILLVLFLVAFFAWSLCRIAALRSLAAIAEAVRDLEQPNE